MTATLTETAAPASPSAEETDLPEEPTAEIAAPRRPIPPSLVAWRDPHPWVGRAVLLGLLLLAGLTRLWSFGFPHQKIFDEAYYPTEAQELLRYGYEDNRGYMFIVHPPLGKWLIAAGEWLWDDNKSHYLTNSVGWRIAPVAFGIATVLIVTRTARRLFRSNLYGAIAGVLITFDGLSLVLARTALLDVFLQFFIAAGFGALVIDRDKMRARLGTLIADGADLSNATPTLGPRPWRLLAGVCFGLACAVKWTGSSFFLFFIILSLLWDRGALKAAGARKPTRWTIRRAALPGIGSLVIAPLAAYLFCYLGWFAGENAWGRHWADTHSASGHLDLFGLRIPFWWGWVPGPIRSLGAYTLDAYRFHEGLDSGHAYAAGPWNWLVLGRPVNFYYNGSGGTAACGATSCSKQVLLIGTPLMWWAFIPMLLWLAWHYVTTRDWRAAAIWVAFAAGWLVWFQDLKRTMFLFYMAPLMPFLIYGLTLAIGTVIGPAVRRTGDLMRDRRANQRRRIGFGAASVFLTLVIADFIWMWPIFTGGQLTNASWNSHMWLPSWV